MSKLWTGPEENTLRQMAKDGHCAEEIAEHMQRSKNSIHAKASQMKVRLAYPSGDYNKHTLLPDYYIKAIKVLKQSGMTAKEISEIFAKRHRVSPNQVHKMTRGINK